MPLPRLCFLSYREIRCLAEPIVQEYRQRAEIEVVDGSFDQALALARERLARRAVDVFVSAGSNASLLRRHMQAPVATIQLTGFDLLQALLRAQQLGPRVGIVTYGQTLPELESVKALLNIEIHQHAYLTPTDCRTAMAQLRAEQVPVVLGSSLVVELAREAGLRGILAYSTDSIRQGFEDALDLARVARLEAARHEELHGVLRNLQDAVQAVDREDAVIAASPPLPRRQPQPAARHRFSNLLGDSPAFAQARARAERYARTPLGILLCGESGSGKELFAQAIHNASERAHRPFVAVNCAAFPESLLESELFGHEEGAFTGARRGGKRGLFESAHTGTLFLDEIGDMPLLLQTRLLRVLQEREIYRVGASSPLPVDVRIIAATHQPLARRVAEGRFRQDLFYRLDSLRLDLPPLRERGADLLPLARHLLARRLPASGVATAMAEGALAALAPALHSHPWPGNVRELENMMDRLAVHLAGLAPGQIFNPAEFGLECPEWHSLRGEVTSSTVAAAIPQAQPAPVLEPRPDPHQRALAALARHGHNHAQAARALGVSRTTLWRWLRA